MKIAQWLQVHPGVAWVSYPGLESHPSHKLAKRYLINGFGAVVTLGVKGGAQQSCLFVDNLKLVTNTANLGDSKSLALHPFTTTHQQVSDADRETTGVTKDKNMISFSVGTEHIEDIVEDFEQAFVCLGVREDTEETGVAALSNEKVSGWDGVVRDSVAVS